MANQRLSVLVEWGEMADKYRVFLSYSWKEAEIKEKVLSIAGLVDSVLFVHDTLAIKLGDGVAETIKGSIRSCHALLAVYPSEPKDRRWVIQELCQAATLGLQFYVLVESSKLEELPPMIEQALVRPYESQNLDVAILEAMTQIKEHSEYLPDGQGALRNFRDSLDHGARWLEDTGGPGAATWQRNVALLQSIGKLLFQETKLLSESSYTAQVGNQTHFTARAEGIFSTAQQVRAVSVDKVSQFWLSKSKAELRPYIEAQPDDTHRLFVLDGPDRLSGYVEILNDHFTRYGTTGGVYVTSMEGFNHLVQSVNGGLNRDFAFLTYGADENSVVQLATLDEETLKIYASAELELGGATYATIGEFFETISTLAPGQGKSFDGYYVLRWKLSLNEEDGWAQHLEQLYGKAGPSLHCVTYSHKIVDHSDFPVFLASLKEVVRRSKTAMSDIVVDNFYYGTAISIPGVSVDPDHPFMIVLAFANQRRLRNFYEDDEVKGLRQQLHALVGAEVVEHYNAHGDALSREGDEFKNKLRALVADDIKRYDYVMEILQ